MRSGCRALTLLLAGLLQGCPTDGTKPDPSGFGDEYLSSSKQSAIDEFNSAYRSYSTLADNKAWADAVVHARKAYESGKIVFAPKDKNNAMLAYNYGFNLLQLEQFVEADKYLNESLELYESIQGKNNADLIGLLFDLGRTRKQLGAGDETAYFKRALTISGDVFGEESVDHGRNLVTAGEALSDSQYHLTALEYLLEGQRILEKLQGAAHPDTGLANYNLGKYELSRQQSDRAIEYFNATLATFADPDRPSGFIEITTHGFLVRAYETTGQSERATRHCLAIGRMSNNDNDQKAQPLYRAAPNYPFQELYSGMEGYALIEFDIDENGHVINAHGIERTNENFETAALNAIQKWRYAPAFVDGAPVVTRDMKTTLRFDLED